VTDLTKFGTILVADDDPISRRLLQSTLTSWGYEVVVVENGMKAWQYLEGEHRLGLAILDWMMPGMTGVEICTRARQNIKTQALYLILLTARGNRVDLVMGLGAGANDFITKPYDRDELRARVQVGIRVVELQESLAQRVQELEAALKRVKQLQGLLPICSYCKKVRDDSNYWQRVEHYISEHSEVQFSHGICPECFEKIVKPRMQGTGSAESEGCHKETKTSSTTSDAPGQGEGCARFPHAGTGQGMA
jgi:CheY-like chemotaxis protein